MKIKEIKANIKGVFKLPIKEYYLGKLYHGSPYMYPRHFNSTILTIKKELPKFNRCNHLKLFGYNIIYGWPISIVKYDLGWKDKFNSPRFEWCPSFQILFLKWQFCIWWISPDKDNDTYWEQVLWYLNYSGRDINKAIKTWGWVNYDTKLSTWNYNFLIKQYEKQ